MGFILRKDLYSLEIVFDTSRVTKISDTELDFTETTPRFTSTTTKYYFDFL